MPNRMERFTQRARNVLTYAQQEAERLQHNTIGAEHLLPGLMREDSGVAGRVLRELGLEQGGAKELVERLTRASARTSSVKLDLSPSIKEVLELSVNEARRMGHHYIGTEHLLLGLVRQSDGVVIEVLKRLGVSPEEIHSATRRALQEAPQSPSTSPSALSPTPDRERYHNFLRELGRTPLSDAVLDRLTVAVNEAQRTQMQQVEIEHLFLSLLQAHPDIWDILGYNRLDVDVLREKLRQSIEQRRQK